MSFENYPIPPGVHAIPSHLLDLRPDSEIDQTLLNPPPITSEKNIWFFWHSGYTNMHPYSKRNIRSYHRRFSKINWTIRVLDRLPNSPLNVSNFLDISDPTMFPKAFCDGTIRGDYAAQHTSDLVRWPLLLKYGGIYADVGLMQIGDLERIWNEKIANPESKYEILSYQMGADEPPALANYFLVAMKNNPLFLRCHKLLLKLWEGRIDTVDMHVSPLLKGLPLMGESGKFTIEEKGKRTIPAGEVSKLLTDYIIQGQVMNFVMGLVDVEDNWDGPRYVREHVYGIEYMVGSQLVNEITKWNGVKAFELMCLKLPGGGGKENDEQKMARKIVEECLGRSFGFKLAHGLILRVLGETLGSLWRANEGSDDVEGTYAKWLRHGTCFWNQDEIPEPVVYKHIEPYKRGPLLREN